MTNKNSTLDFDLYKDWFAVSGFLIFQWNIAERHIDECVHILHQAKKRKKGKPLNLNQKLQFIQTEIPQIPEIEFSSSLLEELIKTTKSNSQIRDVISHGLIEEVTSEKMVLSKIDGKKANHEVEHFTIDSERLEIAQRNSTTLANDWRAIVYMVGAKLARTKS